MFNIFNLFKNNYGYYLLKNPNIRKLEKKYSQVWTDAKIPEKQWRLVESQLPGYKKIKHMVVLCDMIKKTKLKHPKILEVCCSSGYLSQVLSNEKVDCIYEGCDFSPSFIKMAKEKYPKFNFKVSDATALTYNNSYCDILISGCCLLHIVNYEKAIAEAVRVSKKYVVFYRTPVLKGHATVFLTKHAYGVKMLEIHFNETELVKLFEKYGLKIISQKKLSSFIVPGLSEKVIMKNYLCQKK